MRKGIFVTGTGTEVGKTVITRALARALVHRPAVLVADLRDMFRAYR